ncbi:hypothetical protein L0F63_004980, partial [Massospora cicadina]
VKLMNLVESGLTEREKQLLEEERVLNAKLDATIAANHESFPKAVYFIIPNEFCERFCFYGIKNLLNQYLKSGFGIPQPVAKSYVHLFNGLVYAFPLAGAALSDSYFGKYHTIVYLSLVYLVGNALLSLLSINQLVAEYGAYPVWTALLPLLLIAVGTGGIKPCVSSHGGDQFLPSQAQLLDRFFALFYVSINIGALIAQYLTPFLKEGVTCFKAHCYFLAFGVPTVLFGLALIVFVAGFRHYRVVPPSKEFLPFKAAKTACVAAFRYARATREKRASVQHWLYLAEDVAGKEFVEETRLLGKMLVMSIPIIFFWVLYDQNGTEWQNQYEMMNHKFLGLVNIPTEASSNLNSILIILFVPLLSYVVYPFLERRGLAMALLPRMVLGYLLVILAFIASIILQYGGGQCRGCVPRLHQRHLAATAMDIVVAGEAMMSPTGVQFAYTQVGRQMKASATSIWLLTTAFGNYVIMAMEFGVGGLYAPTRQWIYTGVSSLFFLIFLLLSKFWYVSKEEEDASHTSHHITETSFQ